MCVSFAVTGNEFGTFTVRYRLKNLWMWCIKEILTALLFGEWWKIVAPSVKITIYLGSTKSITRLNFTSGTTIFYHSLMSSQYLYIIAPVLGNINTEIVSFSYVLHIYSWLMDIFNLYTTRSWRTDMLYKDVDINYLQWRLTGEILFNYKMNIQSNLLVIN